MSGETDYLCVGICLPDADEAYCIGCGRPWGTASVPSAVVPADRDAVPPAPTLPGEDDDKPEPA
ncbi:MAG: DUF1289 domain-containing protein [Rhodocyclaceae bacterium]